MSFLPGLNRFLHLAAIPIPKPILERMKKANTIAEGIVLPHGLQSVAARQTRMGKMHSTHTGMLIVNGVLTYFTLGLYAAIVAAAIQLAKERRARQLKDKMQRLDADTNSQLDALDAEAERLSNERLRIANGGAVDPNFPISNG